MKIRAAAYRKSDINYFAEGSKQDIAKGLSKKIKKKLKKLKS
jgi:hypothetical protein